MPSSMNTYCLDHWPILQTRQCISNTVSPLPLQLKGSGQGIVLHTGSRRTHARAATACANLAPASSSPGSAVSAEPHHTATSLKVVNAEACTAVPSPPPLPTASVAGPSYHCSVCRSIEMERLRMQELHKLLKLIPDRFLEAIERRADLQEVWHTRPQGFVWSLPHIGSAARVYYHTL